MASNRFRVSAVEASAACKVAAEFLQSMLAYPLDRRESNAWIRVRQKARQNRLSLRMIRFAQNQKQAQALFGREIL